MMKVCPNYPGYMADESGNIFSIYYKRNMKPATNNWGYLNISLVINKRPKKALVHRMVADAFLPNPYEKEEVNHRNGIKSDNRLINLEWVTKSENRIHSYRTLNNIQGFKANAKLSPTEVNAIRFFCSPHGNGIILAKIFGVTPANISYIKNKFSWSVF